MLRFLLEIDLSDLLIRMSSVVRINKVHEAPAGFVSSTKPNNSYDSYLISMVQKLEQEYVKMEILYSFIKSEGVKSEIEEEVMKIFDNIYIKMEITLNLVEDKANGLGKHCK